MADINIIAANKTLNIQYNVLCFFHRSKVLINELLCYCKSILQFRHKRSVDMTLKSGNCAILGFIKFENPKFHLEILGFIENIKR